MPVSDKLKEAVHSWNRCLSNYKKLCQELDEADENFRRIRGELIYKENEIMIEAVKCIGGTLTNKIIEVDGKTYRLNGLEAEKDSRGTYKHIVEVTIER